MATSAARAYPSGLAPGELWVQVRFRATGFNSLPVT
jgi:hypothetical protein